jgi:hypothetical protein
MTTISINVTGLEVKADRHIGELRPHLVLDVEMTREAIYEAVELMLGTLADQQVGDFLREKFSGVFKDA